MKSLVIGLGNPILTDDGVGLYAAREIQQQLPPDVEVDVVELSVGGLALMEAMVGYERVILIDALWQPDRQPGGIILCDTGSLPDTLHIRSVHDVDLITALRVGQQLGAPLPAQENIHIIAVQVLDVLNFSEKLTPAVEKAVLQVVKLTLNLLGPRPCNVSPPYHLMNVGEV